MHSIRDNVLVAFFLWNQSREKEREREFATDMFRLTFCEESKVHFLHSRFFHITEIQEHRDRLTLHISSEQGLNIPDAYKHKSFNPEVDRSTGYVTKSVLCWPLFDSATNKVSPSPLIPYFEERLSKNQYHLIHQWEISNRITRFHRSFCSPLFPYRSPPCSQLSTFPIDGSPCFSRSFECGQCLGVIELMNKKGNATFTVDDENLLDTFCVFFSYSLHNAKSVSSLREAKLHLKGV